MFKHVLPTIEYGAVGNHALAINNELQSRRIEFDSYAETIRDPFKDLFKTMKELENSLNSNDVVFYQLAGPSPMADLLAESKCSLIVNYHNITPARFFDRWSSPTANAITAGRAQLAKLAPLTKAAIAVSNYNASELVELGYRNVEVIPPVFSDKFYSNIGDKSDLNRWLYVGRIAPHKNIHVLIRAFELFCDNYNPDAQLTIVGSCDTPLYGKAIDELIIDRNLSEKISIANNAPLEKLEEIYSKAGVFVMASEHEGFCVPIIEAMASSVPVVAVNKAAIGETSSSAAILVKSPDPYQITEAVIKLMEDEDLRVQQIERGLTRSQLFHPQTSLKLYGDYIQGLIK